MLFLFAGACNRIDKEPVAKSDSVLLSVDKTKNSEKSVTFEKQTYTIPTAIAYHSFEKDYLSDALRLIGWSEDGIIAYVAEPADEACGCYFFSFVIQDLNSDKELYRWDFNDNGAGMNLDSVWFKNKDLFTSKLNEYHIYQEQHGDLENGELLNKGKKYKIKFSTTTEVDKDLGLDLIREVKIEVDRLDPNPENLLKLSEKYYDYTLNAGLSGYLKSPFEDRLAIVFWYMNMGYEGPPHKVTFRITGCSLE